VSTTSAGIEYFERVVMEADVRRRALAEPNPSGMRLVPWHRESLEAHSHVLARSFVQADDGRLFRRLQTLDGCRAIIREISVHPGFDPTSTFTIEDETGVLGCVQGIRRDRKVGAIQNLAVVPERRGEGVGYALLQAACRGFRDGGLRYVVLEVTADNRAALALYHRMGFAPRRRFLRAAEVRSDE
jgi:ribosomal protein S18 acetylase RimI-like enzyme